MIRRARNASFTRKTSNRAEFDTYIGTLRSGLRAKGAMVCLVGERIRLHANDCALPGKNFSACALVRLRTAPESGASNCWRKTRSEPVRG